MWCNKSFFGESFLDGSAPERPFFMENPTPIPEYVSPEEPAESSKPIQEGLAVSYPVTPKEPGLVTLSGLPVSHWKNLFHLDLVKQRNKPEQKPEKPPSAPFFLQWRSGEKLDSDPQAPPPDDEWEAAWSDDETQPAPIPDPAPEPPKRRKFDNARSDLATLLLAEDPKPVSDHLATLGPSAVDVALSSLCRGIHDQEGLELLAHAARWLLELCRSRKNFETANAYLARFLALHAPVLAGVREDAAEDADDGDAMEDEEMEIRRRLLGTIEELRVEQKAGCRALREKMQYTLCLLKNFSQMV